MAERNSDRIRGVIRPRYGGQMQNPAHHVHDLPFFRLAVSDNGLLDLHGGIFVNRYAVLPGTEKNYASCFRNHDAGSDVILEEQFLHRHGIRLIRFNNP